MMHGHEKSSCAIGAWKPTNKAEHAVAEQSATERTAAEPVEPRAEAEGNGRPAQHAPGTVPGTRAPGAGLHTAQHRRGYPRWEPYAGKLHVRVCAGGARQLASLPRLRRRDLITLLGGAAAWTLTARAQPAARAVVGLISAGAADPSAGRVAAFRKGLSEAGYAEGQNVIVEYDWLEGHYDRLPAVLTDLVHRRVAVSATPGGVEAAFAAKTATTTIPIVFGVSEDPVVLGIVANLARPGGNATGVNFLANEIDAKRFGLMHELLP